MWLACSNLMYVTEMVEQQSETLQKRIRKKNDFIHILRRKRCTLMLMGEHIQ